MINGDKVNVWLSNYVEAWKSYDPEVIGALFSEDARYYYTPSVKPLEGRKAIVADWLKNADKKCTYTGEYKMIGSNGNLAVANGRSTYVEADGKTVNREFDNVFILEFNDVGECTLYKEWYMKVSDSED